MTNRADVVSYAPPTPRGAVQRLALARAQSVPKPPRTSAEIAEFALRYLREHGDSSARDIAKALYGCDLRNNWSAVGTALAFRQRTVGDIGRRRVTPYAKNTSRSLWFLQDTARATESHEPALQELSHRLDRIEADVRQVLSGLKAIFRCTVWEDAP